jgi:hypothetical protein
MLRASSETAVATLTEVNFEKPRRTASDHDSRRAAAMSFSLRMVIRRLLAEGSGAAGSVPAPSGAVAGCRSGAARARAHEAISAALLPGANSRTELSSSVWTAWRSPTLSRRSGLLATPPRRRKMLRWVISEIEPSRMAPISLSTVLMRAARASPGRHRG